MLYRGYGKEVKQQAWRGSLLETMEILGALRQDTYVGPPFTSLASIITIHSCNQATT